MLRMIRPWVLGMVILGGVVGAAIPGMPATAKADHDDDYWEDYWKWHRRHHRSHSRHGYHYRYRPYYRYSDRYYYPDDGYYYYDRPRTRVRVGPFRFESW